MLEDAARFVLDDRELCESLKHVRHDLASALSLLPASGAELALRDTPGDVGTTVSTLSEHRREGVRDVAIANAKRLTEALRSIEEYSKTVQWNPGCEGGGVLTSPERERGVNVPHSVFQEPVADAPGSSGQSLSARFEQLRYRAYDLEQKLVLAMGSARARQWRLCVILTESLCTHHSWLEVARQAIDAGADCLQLREKSLDAGELLSRACQLVELARPRGVSVIINDRPDIALLARADGVHVGQTDLSVRDVRSIVGFDLIVGVSTTTIEQAKQARRDGADYCGVGPVFATNTKSAPGGRRDGSLAGLDYVRAYTSHEPAFPPHLAIGGITPENVAQVFAAGAKGVAVSGAVCGAKDVRLACQSLLGDTRP